MAESSRKPPGQGPGSTVSPPGPSSITRSSFDSESIDFSKPASSSPQPVPVSVPVPRTRTGSSGSPKPVGPRSMTPPTKEGRRLSYTQKPGEERKSMDDQRRGLGVGYVPGQGGRRVSEGGLGLGMGVAGPSRVRPRTAGTEETAREIRSSANHGRSRTSSTTTPPGSRESSATRRPVLRPRQPSDNPRPTIRVVHPTPRSQQPHRRTSAPPESPVSPTRTRPFSPILSHSRASSSSSASASKQNQSSSSSRSIRPGTRRTSYQLAKTSSNDGSSGSAISEFGVIGENGESPYLSNFAERFEQGSNEIRQPSPHVSPALPQGPSSSSTTPLESPSEPASPIRPNGMRIPSDTSSIATNSTSSFVSARSPTSPPRIPQRLSSNPVSPRIGKRTTSIESISTNNTPRLPSKGHIPTLGPIARTISRDSIESNGTVELDRTRRDSDATAMAPSRRQSTNKRASKELQGPASPRMSTKPTTPNTSPRPDRKSPGLTINPLAPPRPARDSARPSPPVPVKSPLRRTKPQPSTLSEFSSEGQAQKVRDGSGESTAATSDSFLTAPLPSPALSSSGSLVLEPGEVVPFPESYDSHGADEIRFTMLTVPSVYSQDSAPSTGRSIVTRTTDNESLRSSRSGSFGWGMQRHSVISLEGYGLDDFRRTSLPRLRTSITDTSKRLPDIPSSAAESAASSSTRSRHGDQGHSPFTPARSPSMPVMNPIIEAPRKASALLGVATATITRPPSGGMTRSQTTPLGGQFPSTSATDTQLPISPVPSTKRSHLLREIVNTERSYANDLALIRDAYLLRYIRPTSQVSNESTVAFSEQSRRSSVYTYQTAETKRSSGHEISSNWIAVSPFQKSPIAEYGQSSNYFSPLVPSTSATSLAATLARVSTSSRNTNGASSTGSMAPPVGRPLSPVDIRTVFLNLDQLAMAAEEMANAMDKALGEEGGQVKVGRDGESGSDRLGEVFVTLMPRYRPLYEYYCARQSTAFVRLTEILADPVHRTFLDECWSHVKPHTHAWNLDSMLIKPIQRITKYPLLFDDLLACTTPVHPDYFNIRNAAAMAKSVAQEIDETKRRKDVVAGVISKKQKSQSNLTPSNAAKPKGLKMFRKDKSTTSVPLTTSISTSAMDSGSASGLVAEITKASLSHFKDLVHRVDQYDQCVRKLGKEIILWTAAAKDICMIQDGLVKAWLGLVSLDGLEGPDPKLVWFRKVIAGIVNESWRVLNDQVQDQIMPSLAKLLESGVNPRKVILKRDSRAPDYARYFTLIEQKRPMDKPLLQSAHDFVALHTHLVEELPPFLEGYMRIFDLCIRSFANAQAKYHSTVQEKIEGYVKEYLDGIKRSPDPQLGEIDLGTGRGIEKNWRAGWQPFVDVIETFAITKPARQLATRLATFQDRPGSHTHTRQLSGQSSSNIAVPARPATPGLSPTFLKDQKRNRSTSLMGPPPLPSPTRDKTSFFGINKKTTPNPAAAPPTVVSPMKAIPRLRSPSPLDPGIRNSFGLPTISPDNGKFSGLGWSPSKPSQNLRHASDPYARPSSRHSRNGSTSSISSNVGLGIGLNAEPSGFTSLLRRKSSDGRSRKSSNGNSAETGSIRSVSRKEKLDRRRKAVSMVSPAEPTRDERPGYVRTKSEMYKEVDAAAGWRRERVLYQCACVAYFDPDEIGRRRYRGLHFLSMAVGDLFDVLHEVGRIDELPNFPYPELGVENDGILVARAEDQTIGLIICSFLEPLT